MEVSSRAGRGAELALASAAFDRQKSSEEKLLGRESGADKCRRN